MQVLRLPELEARDTHIYISGTREVTEAGTSLAPLLLSKWGAASANPTASSVVDGAEYVLGDFVVRFGLLKTRRATKCLVAEIEYTPCASVAAGRRIIDEFRVNLGPMVSQAVVFESFAEVGLGDTYTVGHTARQYLKLFQSTM